MTLVIGCGGPAVPVNRVMVGGEMQPAQTLAQEVDPCTASRRITVVAANGAPIEGARIDVEQRVSEHANEETLAVWSYRAVSARTDALGRAVICEPSRLSPAPQLQGIAGGYSDHGLGEIVVTAGAVTSIVRPPFPRDVHVVIPVR